MQEALEAAPKTVMGDAGDAGGKSPALKDLFDFKYLRTMSPLKWAALIAYAPFGTVIAFVRIILTVILCTFAILSKKYLPWTISDRTYASRLPAASRLH